MGCSDLAKKGEEYLSRALELATKIPSGDLRNSSLAAIVKILADEKLYDFAKKTIDKIDDKELKMQSMRDLALNLIHDKQLAEGIDIIRNIDVEEFRTAVLSEAIKKLLDIDMYDEAQQLLELMSEESIYRDEALKSIAVYYAKKGNIDEALRVISHIRNPIVRAVAKGEVSIFAEDLRDKLIREAISEIEGVKDKIFFGLGDKSYLRDFGLTSQKILELQNIAFLAKKANLGDLVNDIQKRILEMLNSIQELDERYDLMSLLIRRAANYEEPLDISDLINELAKQINAIENPLVRAQLLRDVAIYRLRTGDREKARRIIRLVLDQLKNVTEIYQRDSLLKDLGVNIIKSGNPDLILEIIDDIDEPRFRLELMALYAGVADKEKVVELIKNAENLLNEIYDDTWLAHALIRLVEGYMKVGNQDKVRELLERFESVVGRISNDYTKSTLFAMMGAKLLSSCS